VKRKYITPSLEEEIENDEDLKEEVEAKGLAPTFNNKIWYLYKCKFKNGKKSS